MQKWVERRSISLHNMPQRIVSMQKRMLWGPRALFKAYSGRHENMTRVKKVNDRRDIKLLQEKLLK